jgi:hypothetical protein
MASRGEELNTRLTADDQASAVVDKVAGKMADLEDRDHEVDVTGDTSDVDSDLTALDRRLRGLTDDEKRIVLDLAAKDAQRDIDRLNRDLARADKYDDTTISMIVNAKGDAERKLEAIQGDIRQIDGATPTVRPEVDSSELDEFVSKLGGIGGLGGAIGSAATPAAAVAAVLGASVNEVRNMGVEIRTIATVLDITTEEASRLRAVFVDTGIEANDLQDIALQITGALDGNADMAARLKISLDDAKNPAEALKAAIDGWDFLSATERSQLFGEEGVRQIGQIIARGQDFDSLMAGVEKRRVFSQEDIDRAGQLNEIVGEFRGQLEGLTIQIGGPFVDAIAQLDAAVGRLPGTGEDFGVSDAIGNAIRGGLSGNFTGGPSFGDVLSEQLFGSDEAYERKKKLIQDTIDGAIANTETATGSAKEYASAAENAGVKAAAALRVAEERFGGVNDEMGGAILRAQEWGATGAGAAEEFSSAAENAGVKAAAALRVSEERFGGVNDEMGGAILRAEEWGQSIADAADDAGGKVDALGSKLEGIAGRLSEKGAVDDLADQWDRVIEAQGAYWAAQEDETKDGEKEQRDYRDELGRLADDVLRFSEQVGGLPEEKLVKLLTAIDDENVAAVQRALDELFADRTIGIRFGGGSGPNFKLGEDGKPVLINPDASSAQTFATERPAVNQTINYVIAPTPSQLGEGIREDQLWNAPRPR